MRLRAAAVPFASDRVRAEVPYRAHRDNSPFNRTSRRRAKTYDCPRGVYAPRRACGAHRLLEAAAKGARCPDS